MHNHKSDFFIHENAMQSTFEGFLCFDFLLTCNKQVALRNEFLV